MKPLYDCVLVRREEKDETSEGGIVLHYATNLDSSNRGEVVAVGPGRKFDDGSIGEVSVTAGDKIIFGPHNTNNTIRIDGEELLILNEEEIYAVVD